MLAQRKIKVPPRLNIEILKMQRLVALISVLQKIFIPDFVVSAD